MSATRYSIYLTDKQVAEIEMQRGIPSLTAKEIIRILAGPSAVKTIHPSLNPAKDHAWLQEQPDQFEKPKLTEEELDIIKRVFIMAKECVDVNLLKEIYQKIKGVK